MEGFPSVENKAEGVRQQLIEVQSRAFTVEEARSIKEKMDLLHGQGKDKSMEMQAVMKELGKSIVTVRTEPEFIELMLDAGISEEHIHNILSRRDYNKHNEGYALLVTRGEDGFHYNALELTATFERIEPEEIEPAPIANLSAHAPTKSQEDLDRIKELEEELRKGK